MDSKIKFKIVNIFTQDLNIKYETLFTWMDEQFPKCVFKKLHAFALQE